MAVWTESVETETEAVRPDDERLLNEAPATERLSPATEPKGPPTAAPEAPAKLLFQHGWPVPSSLSHNPNEARAGIQLPEFDALLLEKARVISGRFPLAEAEYRNLRGTDPSSQLLEIPHFERVFRIAANLASVTKVHESPDYDAVLILTAWH